MLPPPLRGPPIAGVGGRELLGSWPNLFVVPQRLAPGLVALAVALAGCAPVAPPSSPDARGQSAAAPKRIVAAVMGDPHTLYNALNQNNSVPGIDALQELVHVGLTHADRFGVRGPRLAEAVPRVESGLWRVLPDGRMELTWTLRSDAAWHDGAPVTSADLLFTTRLEQDRELPVLRNRLYDSIEAVETPDARTVVVRWKRAYIDADEMFSYAFASPLPRHILERPYNEEKATFFEHPYWTTEYVGAGAYRVRNLVRGSHLILDANDRYVLGRPKIDVIEVRFILDSNTLLANLLAGAVDVTLGRTISLDQAVQIRDQWGAGRIDVGYKSWIVLYPQFLSPSPPIVADLQFRRALMHAIDRQQLADSLMAGMSAVAHNYLNPQEPEYRDTDRYLTRYEYDPQQAIRLIEALGYSRGQDGGFRDARGARLSVNIQTTGQLDIHTKTMYPVADFWQRIGVAVETFVTPAALVSDREHRATFPAFSLAQNPDDKGYLANFHSTTTPLAENNYVGGNRARYRNAAFDALLDQYFVTIPQQERVRLLGEIVGHITEQLTLMGLFYGAEPTAVSTRVENVWPRIQASTQARNAHEWDVR